MAASSPVHTTESAQTLTSLSAQELSFSYNGTLVLKDVSLELQPGRLVGVIGPNGAGKTTLVRLLSGLLRPDSGRVMLEGKPLAAWSRKEIGRRLAVVPQSPQLPETFTAAEIVLLGRTPYLGLLGNESAHDREVAHRAMERTQCWHLAERLIGTLSGGERQRVVVARALAQEAPVLLLDEPTTHMDVNHQLGLVVLVKHLVQQYRLAALVILHDLNLASVYCDELILLAEGRVVARGQAHEVITPEQIRSAYRADILVMAHPQTGRPVVVPEVWT